MTYSLYYCEQKGNKDEPIDVDFVDWITKVENIVFSYLQIDLIDLADEMYMWAYENDANPIDFGMYIVSKYEDYL
jgi:hypothetical protein